MSAREAGLLFAFLVALALLVWGVFLIWLPAALIVAGIGVGLIGFLLFGEVS